MTYQHVICRRSLRGRQTSGKVQGSPGCALTCADDTMVSMTTTSFPEQLQAIWRTRPIRLPNRAPIAGVAAGIGYRYGIDPVLVRVAFVVSTIFGGAGILVYLGAWLLFPRAGDQVSAAEALFGRGRSSESRTRSIVLSVAFVIALTTVPAGMGAGLIGTALLLAGWWLLYQRTPVPPAPLGPAPQGAVPPYQPFAGPFGAPRFGAPAAAPTEMYNAYTRLPDKYVPETPTVSLDKDGPADAGPMSTAEPAAPQPQPPSWDPLGVAPFAWDLPEPARPAPAPDVVDRPRSRITPAFLGLAIIAGAAASAVAIAGVGWLTPARIGAIALGVIGIGLVSGAFLRRGYGLLLAAVPLAGFVVLASVIGPITFDGRQQWKPASLADLQPSYSISGGGGQLDLRSVQLTSNRTVDLHTQVGGIEVIVPKDMKVQVDCRITAGDCNTKGIDGRGTSAGTLTLNVDGRLGGVEVHRD